MPEIVHTHGGTAGFYGRLASRRIAARTVHTYHGLHYLRGGDRLKRIAYAMVDRWLCRRTSWTICVSQSDHELAILHRLAQPTRSEVIRNGIDVGAFSSSYRARIEEGGADRGARGPVIGTIGRLNPEKGHALLVEAAGIVLQEMPSVSFSIIGDGSQRGSLERLIASKGLVEQVQLPGSTHDVARVLSGFDVFVLPSHWEGLPISLLEAMASGLPIVATRVGGIPEVVGSSECAILVPPNDPNELASAILRLLRDPQRGLPLSKAAFERVSSEFGIQRMIERTEAVYRKVLEATDG
jgi:glycosyltransferase involved in cell wall biosynthesis